VSRARCTIANLALGFAGVLAAFLIAEAVVRVAGLAKPSLYTWAPHRGWGLKPDAAGWQRDEGEGFVRVNSVGFRGPEWTVAKPPDTFRIAVLGDSFTEAPQVAYEQTFSATAEGELARCGALAGKKIEVMNFGTDGYGTAQELITMRRHAWRYSPDMVVLAFFSGNDLRNNSVTLEGDKCRPFYIYEGGRLVLGGPFERSRWFRLSCMMRFESRHSQVLNLIGDAKSQIRARIKAMESRRPSGHESEGSGRERASGVELVSEEEPADARQAHSGSHAPLSHEEGLEDSIYHPPATGPMKDAWRVTEGIIAMMAREVAAHHARFLVVTLANPPQIYPDPRLRASYMQLYGSTNIFYPDERVKALGEREGFDVLNLAPLMQAYADEHHVYLTGFNDTKMGVGHWNAAGQRLAGELIAKKTCEMLRVGTEPAAVK